MQAAKSRAANGGGTVQIHSGARASAELDIRGLETLEAESVVENYLDAAQRSKLGSVTIIHGKGTGALRAAVHQMLKKNRAVKSFRLGRYGEGEAGVTVVELKRPLHFVRFDELFRENHRAWYKFRINAHCIAAGVSV